MKKLTILLLISIASAQQSSIPNSFLGFEIGGKMSEILSSNPDATEGVFWVLHTDIITKGMKVYTVNRVVSSGDKVKIDLCFYNNILSVLSVKYSDWQTMDLFAALLTKYGEESSFDGGKWTDPLNGKQRTTYSMHWYKENYILNVLYTKEIGLAELVYAEKAVQNKLANIKHQNSLMKLE